MLNLVYFVIKQIKIFLVGNSYISKLIYNGIVRNGWSDFTPNL